MAGVNETRQPLSFTSAARWRQWLRKNHGRDCGAWVLIAKKGTPRGLHYAQALEEALCWGWIDGKLHRHEGGFFALWFSPRRPRSIWSRANREEALRLIAQGRMREPGMARVLAAKANGQWERAYSSGTQPRMAADVRRALESAGALADFRAMSPSRRLQLLSWVAEAKRAETRARRISELPRLLKA